MVNLKLTDNGPVYKLSHIADSENLLGIYKLDEYVNDSLFNVSFFLIFLLLLMMILLSLLFFFNIRLDLVCIN